MSKICNAALPIALLLCVACADERWQAPPAISQQQFLTEFEQWREWRRTRLTQPGSGPITWIGLWELPSGATSIGSDSAVPIVLPAAQVPKRVGTLHRKGSVVSFDPAADASIRLANGNAVTDAIVMNSDRTDSPTTLAIGSLRLRVHGEPGTDRLWVRAWDEEHPLRKTFKLPDTYPADMTYRLAARFEPFDKPREYLLVDERGGTQGYRAPGELVFRLHGKERRLVAFAEPKDTTFFVMMWDSTARTATYQAGRYLRVRVPDSTRWTLLDFNRAYNPPCVFTAYSVCAFAPPENRMQVAVAAGEKRLIGR